ncbi:hypothetical protein [Sorlinia euscelidii]
MTYALVAMLERATSTAQAEAVSLTRLVDMIRAERGQPESGKSGTATCCANNEADPSLSDRSAPRTSREDQKFGSRSEHSSL